MITFALIVLLVGLSVAMNWLSWQFHQRKRHDLKNRLADYWPQKRIELLYLRAGNGFMVFRDLLLEWSRLPLHAAACLLPLTFSMRLGLLACLLILGGHWFRLRIGLGALKERKALCAEMWAYDGAGVYGMAQETWGEKYLSRERSRRVIWLLAVIVLLIWVIVYAAGR